MCNFVKSLMDSGNNVDAVNPFQPHGGIRADEPVHVSFNSLDDAYEWDRTQVTYIAATFAFVTITSLACLAVAYRRFNSQKMDRTAEASKDKAKAPPQKKEENALVVADVPAAAADSELPSICTQLPVDLKDRMSLKKLDLSDTDASFEVDDTWQQLVQIEYLNLSNHRFYPDSWEIICAMKSLKTLVLQHAQLTSVHSEIAGLEKLERLDVSFNQIASIDFRSESLSDVCLRHNQIRELPMCITEFPKLRQFDLRDNPLELPAEEVFDQMKHHFIIDFRGCEFTSTQKEEIRKFANKLNDYEVLTTVFLFD